MANLLSDEILEMALQSLEIEDRRNIRLVCRRFKRIMDWSIKICIVLGKTDSSSSSSLHSHSSCSSSSSSNSSGRRGKDAELYYPSKYQYVTCISIAGERKELQFQLHSAASSEKSDDSIPGLYQFPINFEPLSLFSHCKLRRLVIGQGVSGLSSLFISRILGYSCRNLEKLGWNIDVSERKIRNSDPDFPASFTSPISSKPRETPNSFIKGLDFRNLTELSLKFVQKPGREENTRVFLNLLHNNFPKLYSLSLYLISEPIAIFSVSKSIYEGKQSSSRNMDINQQTDYTFQYENSWPVYFETFHFISKHTQTLRVLELDYSHLKLEDASSHISAEPNSKDQNPHRHWHWENFEKIEKVKIAFTDLELHTLDLVCPKMEGIFPWTFCSSLLSTQHNLTDLMLKTRGNPHLLSVDSTLRQNKYLENLYFSNPDNWSNPNPTGNPNGNSNSSSNSNFPHSPFLFDFASIKHCDKLTALELNYCSGFINTQDIPLSLRKLKLRSIFTPEDLTELLLNCPYLRKLHLHNDGNFWREVSLDTVKTILDHGPCLRKLFMDNFDVTSVQEYCEQREDFLRLTVLKRNKGRLKIGRGNGEKRRNTSTAASTNTSTSTSTNRSSTTKTNTNTIASPNSTLISTTPSSSRKESIGDGENSENEAQSTEKDEREPERAEQQQQLGEGTCSNSNFNSISIVNSLGSEENC